ncbi:MAG: helix-turn-helix domain-containing protein [Myxococcota bacterium]|nr:helix-turn-helix domain-containing protein [Myxococcota bacterium]MEC9441877.1 helix-turn-helix domain-containing protein [Myxococcota bacterium]
MDLKKEVFTTFEAANLCNANVSSIKNWIEKGELDAFRTPGGHYRIRNNSLSEFLDKHGMPNPLAETGTKVVAAFQEDQILSILSEELEHIEFFATSHILDTLLLLGEHQPRHVILSERCLLDLDTRDVIAAIRRNHALSSTSIIVVTEQPRAFEYAANIQCTGSPKETARKILEHIARGD